MESASDIAKFVEWDGLTVEQFDIQFLRNFKANSRAVQKQIVGYLKHLEDTQPGRANDLHLLWQSVIQQRRFVLDQRNEAAVVADGSLLDRARDLVAALEFVMKDVFQFSTTGRSNF